ncbi:MAG TPA: histidine kinase [Ktedonobacteraceae bacterium]|jgi:NarL family two-component system sensor histidine kinase YdfH
MLRPQQHSARNDLLRGYLLLWISLAALWGLLEIGNRAVLTAWTACESSSGLPEVCEQLKQHLDTQGRPEIASLPPAVLAALLWVSVTIFLLFLLLFALLLWLSLSEKRRAPLLWSALAGQGVLACALGLGVPALSVTVPVSLVLVLILEVCAIFLRVPTTLAISCAIIICFFLASVLAWSTGKAFHESSLDLTGTLLLLVIGFLFVGGFFLFYSRLARMHLALETAYRRLAAASEQVEALTLVTERQRMARELHDTLAQGLAGLILQLGVVHARVREHQDQEIRVILEQILTSARETLANARCAIDDLRLTTAFPQELLAAAQEEVQRFTLLAGIPCETDLELLSQVPPAHSEQALGVIRESLANVARHARARRAWVRVSRNGLGLCLEVGDDGVGFHPLFSNQQPGHYGLLGLKERAHLAGGHLKIVSKPGQGTRIRVSLPDGNAQNGDAEGEIDE